MYHFKQYRSEMKYLPQGQKYVAVLFGSADLNLTQFEVLDVKYTKLHWYLIFVHFSLT
jgi:hypothetical protein